MRIQPPPGGRNFDRSELHPCAICGKGLMHDGEIAWYTLEIAQVMADVDSIRQQHGLEVMMGPAAALASVFAPSTRVGVVLPPTKRVVCGTCLIAHPILASLWSEEA